MKTYLRRKMSNHPVLTGMAVVGIIIAASFLTTSNDRYPTNSKHAIMDKLIAEESKPTLCEKIRADYTFDNGQKAFENFNNFTGVDCFIVPNIIHFIRFNQTEFSFVNFVVILAAMRHHRPDWMYIHTNVPEFSGKYWDRMMQDRDLSQKIQIKRIELPSEIFGQPLSYGWRFYHGSDVARLRVIAEYGGLYLDNDVFVIHGLDKYRKYESAINWDENQFLGNQVIIGNRDARVLPLWLDTYREYHSDKWYYNAGERPTVEVLYKRPELVHRVKGAFGADSGGSIRLYTEKNSDSWRKLDAIHLLLGHRSYLDPHYKDLPEFTEENIKAYEYPFGMIVRELLDE